MSLIAHRSGDISKLLVDTGSEYTWTSKELLEHTRINREKKDLRFVMANGEQLTRSVGFAILHVADSFTIDEVVFAEPGDLLLLGARTLEGHESNGRLEAQEIRRGWTAAGCMKLCCPALPLPAAL